MDQNPLSSLTSDQKSLINVIITSVMTVTSFLQLLENMTEVVRKGIQEAELQLQKANEEKLLEEVCVCVCVCFYITHEHVSLLSCFINCESAFCGLV